jgi:hypothetical protein
VCKCVCVSVCVCVCVRVGGLSACLRARVHECVISSLRKKNTHKDTETQRHRGTETQGQKHRQGYLGHFFPFFSQLVDGSVILVH